MNEDTYGSIDFLFKNVDLLRLRTAIKIDIQITLQLRI